MAHHLARIFVPVTPNTRALPIGVIIGVFVATSPAAAQRPTSAQALATATAFLESLATIEEGGAAPMTASRFFAVVRDDAEPAPRCGATTATTPSARSALLACLASQHLDAESLGAWKKASRRRLKGPLAGMDMSRIVQLERTATLVTRHTACVGQGADLIVAVTVEKGSRTPVVAAVLAQSYVCGE